MKILPLAASLVVAAPPISYTLGAVFPNEKARKATTARDFLAASAEQRRSRETKGRQGRSRQKQRHRRRADTASSGGAPPPPVSEPLLADEFGGTPGFYHGVASGSPTTDSIILWTRFTPRDASDEVALELRLAEVDASRIPLDAHLDPAANGELKRQRTVVNGDADWTAKLDVVGLNSGTDYVYAFTTIGSTAEGDSGGGYEFQSSQVGMTKTAPAADDAEETADLTYVLLSCAAYANGYFHPYDVASTISDLDLIVHVGDYIYEYGSYAFYADDSKERRRSLQPQWETVSLQDYYRRYAIYHQDEGLQNLHRRAPMIAIWDDHEVADNDYGMGDDATKSGAMNHQETCPANRNSSRLEKNDAHCDFDEGDVVARFQNAARAYLTWMPIRPNMTEESMGVVKGLGSLTQVVEWGNLATFVAFESRVSHRSKEPTTSSVFDEFASFAEVNTNVSQYDEEGSPVKAELDAIANSVKDKMMDPSYTMVGPDSVSLLEDKFRKSSSAGKPWQIFMSSTLMGPNVVANPNVLWEVVPEGYKDDVKSTMDGLIAKSLFLRIITAMAVTRTPWNRDDFNGFAHQRSQILRAFNRTAKNPIVLGGDLHDSWGWVLNGDGTPHDADGGGDPVAINVGAPGVTAPGIGRDVFAEIEPIEALLPDVDGAWLALAKTWKVTNRPGLVHADVRHSGFVAAKATASGHYAEFYGVPADDILSDYPRARLVNGDGRGGGGGGGGPALTSRYFCQGRYATRADEPGSFVEELPCGIKFDTEERPAEWSIPVPEASDADSDGTRADCLLSNVISWWLVACNIALVI